MSDQTHESLSAAMDGEITSFELRRILERTQSEEAIKAKWSRYHLAQQALQGSSASAFVGSSDLVSRVSMAIESESAFNSGADSDESSSTVHHAWWKPFASMAMAASVTAVVILGGQQFVGGDVDPVDSNLRPNFTIQSSSNANGVLRTNYGSYEATKNFNVTDSQAEPEVLRLSQGLNQYIDQHKQYLEKNSPVWQADWLPEGFVAVKHTAMPQAEMIIYSDGRHTVSVSVEPLSQKHTAEGVVQTGDMVAIRLVKENQFITVVGDVPLMIADRIAASVSEVK